MQPGSRVYAGLRGGATEARRAADAAEAAVEAARARLDALAAERLQAIQELARTQLPELSSASAASAWPEATAELARLEQDRQLRARDLQHQLEAAESALRRAEERLQEATTELDAIVARREAIEADVAAALAADPASARAREDAAHAEVALARDLERAEELREDARRKLPAYRDSRLFQYLLRCGFGTPEYRGRGFVARMDRRLADFVGWQRAFASYRFLTTTPKVVQLEVERRTEVVRETVAAVAARERAMADERGMPAVVAEGEVAGRRREAALRELERAQQQVVQLHAALRDEAGSRGRYHHQALARLTEWLGRAEIAALEQRARATPEPRDDVLVARVRDASEELRRVAGELPALEAEARRLDNVADGLDSVLVRFRRAEFDAGRSMFSPIDADQLVQEVRSGRLHWEDMWSRLQSEHLFRAPVPRPSTTDGSAVLQGIGFALRIAGAVAEVALSSRSSGGRSGGGFGIGSSGGRSGGGFGGGGFTSGRGF